MRQRAEEGDLHERGVAAEGASGAVGLLLSRRFGPYFAMQFLSAFNDSALKNALVLILAYGALTGGRFTAEILIPLAGGVFILPFFLLSATAGEFADRWDKARLIRIIKLVEIPVMFAAGFALHARSVPALLALLGVMGVEATFLGPIKYAILPDLLAPEELLLGNALVEAGTFLSILLGTIAGIAVTLPHGALLVALGLNAIALLAWGCSFWIPPTGAADPQERISWNFLVATFAVTRAAIAERASFRLILGISWFWLAGATYLSQFPSFVRFTLGSEAAVVTLFLTIFSVGIGLGSLLCNRLLGGKIGIGTVPWGALGIGLFSSDLWLASPSGPAAGKLAPLAAFLLEPPHWRIMADLLGISISAGVFVVPLYALLQAMTPRAHRARVIGVNNIVNAAAMVLSAGATVALLGAGVSVPGIFLVQGLGTIAIAALFRPGAPCFEATSGPQEKRAKKAHRD
jgi:acyl-[acyl-carrier-protein]-phospholipid O-acyltransferase/long-chain-fatty-acid--[acyl-carrier-protein] ligase